MPTDATQAPAPPHKPGLAKAGKVTLILSAVIIALPFLMLLAGIVGQMIWLEFADTSKPPPFIIEALPWSLVLAPLTTLAGVVGLIAGGLMWWFARRG
ncbi:MAG: hypothetical protein JNM76_12395 [Betaproteobacteria bacterium]|nr:hypothetical protein [Betaproteobacteria bacterium]